MAELSAGSVRARVAPPPGRRPLTVEDALLPPRSGAEVTLGSARWTKELSFPAPGSLQLDAAPRELRPHGAALALSPPVAREVTLDDAVHQVPCAERCTTTLAVSAGTHRLTACWKGGVRPAGRLAVTGAPAEDERRLEYLVARPEAPLVLRVSGPALVGLELRTRLDRQRADGVTVEGAASAAPALEAAADPLARLEGGTPLTVASEVQVAVGPGDGRLVVRPARGEVLVRPSVRQDRDRGQPEARAAEARLGYRVPFEPRAPEPLALVAGEVQPGLDALGEVEAGAEVRRTVLNGLGVDVQPTTQGIASATFRRLAEPLHTAVKVGAEGRFAAGMAPTAWLGTELFFLHPGFRFLRVQLTADGWTQSVAGQQALAARLGLLLESVAPLRPGLSFVGKAAGWVSGRTLRDVPDAQLSQVDPDVFSRYELSHPRGLYLEAGLQWMPFANLVLYGNARLTTNPSFSPFDQDHLSLTALARAVFGRTYVQAQLRGSWFFVDAARPDPAFHPLAQVSVFQTFWVGDRNRLEVGGWVMSRLDATFNPAFSLYVAWAFSNGRRFEDHTPLEGEDAFFPQRGPGRESAHVGAPLER